jgi:Glycogen recognition site of AMP-activated protein kinase
MLLRRQLNDLDTRVKNMSLVHPNSNPDVSNRSYPIGVRFASPVEIEFPVKHMNATNVIMDLMPSLSLFEIAGRIETAVAFSGSHPSQIADAGMIFQPEKIDSNMKTTAQARKVTETKKRSAKSGSGAEAAADKPRSSAKRTQFQLQAPKAGSVKLAADFTEWEKSPLQMNKDDEGIWVASVSLDPGEYAYRFIVDGEWFDDPAPFQILPNPFGTVNSVIQVR